MPLLLVLLVPVLALLLAIVLMPLGVVQRYRANASPRVARPWMATLNITALSISVLLFLFTAALTSIWIPRAFLFSLAGLGCGCLLGILGLALTRWEGSSGRLRYAPNRFLALVITTLVAARLAYSAWRVWHGGGQGVDQQAWIMESGVPGSMAAGAVVLGYSFAYWIGVHRRARAHH